MSNRIVWFKKNLRFKDNEILIDENKKSILIYIIEPELWKQKDMSLRQWQFTLESVNDLKRQLLRNNLHLNIFFGDALEIFKFLKDKHNISSVISEQETGIQWTYQRDKKLKERKEPRKGTGKKPKGSSRRLYTDENPKDTVSVKFRTKSDIQDTLSKKSFKSKSHNRQSQIINLIHQRVRAAYQNAKDPDTKKRLKKAYDYAKQRKEASKRKTQSRRKKK